MHSITRAQFIEAVEAGINAAGIMLSDAERMMLRHVARTETRTARATFSFQTHDGILCLCPLNAAGLVDGTGLRATEGHTEFYGGFDCATRYMIPSDGYVSYHGGLLVTD